VWLAIGFILPLVRMSDFEGPELLYFFARVLSVAGFIAAYFCVLLVTKFSNPKRAWLPFALQIPALLAFILTLPHERLSFALFLQITAYPLVLLAFLTLGLVLAIRARLRYNFPVDDSNSRLTS
jgi:hypothetical protein